MNIIFILLLHAFLLNPLEKSFFNSNLKNLNIQSLRPKCKNVSKCYGMPSGTTELIVIFCSYFIRNWFAIIPIFIVGFLKVYFKRHTIFQIIMGIIFGIFYSILYIHFNYSLFVTLTFILLFSINTKYKNKNKNDFYKLSNIYETYLSVLRDNCLFFLGTSSCNT